MQATMRSFLMSEVPMAPTPSRRRARPGLAGLGPQTVLSELGGCLGVRSQLMYRGASPHPFRPSQEPVHGPTVGSYGVAFCL